MKKKHGPLDKTVRIIIALVIAAIYYAGVIS